MGLVFVIVCELCLLLCGGLCLLLCGGCVCYCMGVGFAIVWGLCLLLCGGCVCCHHFCLVAQI